MGLCDGEIKGNPDIAGTGVVAAIFVNALVATILSLILWVYVFFYARGVHLEISQKHPRWVSMLRDTLIMQGDSQLISDISIIIASLVNIHMDDETPLYHIFISRGLADVALTGYTSTIVLLPRTDHNWIFRLGLVVCTVILYEYWSYIAIERFRRWDSKTPHCLENSNIVPGEYHHWIIYSMFVISLDYLPLCLNKSETGLRWIESFERQVLAIPGVLVRQAKEVFQCRSVEAFLSHAAFFLCSTLICLLLLVFALFIPSSCTLLPAQAVLFTAWSLYDVTIARAANAHIVVSNPTYRPGMSFQNNANPEYDWGFWPDSSHRDAPTAYPHFLGPLQQ